ncbi:MAG: hypothetical protein JWL61_5020 [Gemmatimonadetes bacterium]|nr:hypothetical protein [Gemmatimonadota bacterium]
MRLHYVKVYTHYVFCQLASGQNETVNMYRDGVPRCSTCHLTSCEHANAVADYFDAAYSEDLSYKRQAVAA